MSDRDQSYESAFGRIGSAALVMITAGVVAFSVWQAHEIVSRREAGARSSSCDNSNDCAVKTLQAELRSSLASEENVSLALWQLAFSVAGMGGLAMTVFYARLAWIEAKRSADTAHRTFESDSRPWVSIKTTVEGSFTKSPVGGELSEYRLKTLSIATNHGNKPAIRSSYHSEIGVMHIGERFIIEETLRRYMKSVLDEDLFGGLTIFPREPTGFRRSIFLLEENISGPPLLPYIVGCVNYRSTHSDTTRQTGFLSPLYWEGSRFINPDVPNWWSIEVVMPEPLTVVAD